MNTQMKAKGPTRRSNDEELRKRLLARIPVTERRIEVAGVSTAVLEGGHGSPIVLLHGGIETGGVYWAPVMSRLAESHRLVIPDVPGLGESEPLGRLDDAAFAEWFAALLRLTCHEKPTLVSHSLDGSLAARFATQHGDLLRSLVLYGAPGIGAYRLPLGLLVTAIRFNVRPTDRNNARFADWAFLDPERTRRRDPEWYDAFMAYGLSRGKTPYVKRTMRQLVKAGSKQIPDAELQGIEVPTTLLWGRRDRMAPLRIAELASSKFGWPLLVVEDVGHVPHIEEPEAFLRALSNELVES
ncbi:MAG TPA: alpha/beta hydrolase [Actinomycetota bacterium]|nr:alpha/beta hydrolase [Actinomycetota bacterium]